VLVQRRQKASARVDRLKAVTSLVAQALLGEPGHGRFLPESDFRPFDLAVGGEAYQVLEVLLGDVTCLLDAATSNESNHPGFLVHDCPREADMSALLYKNFLTMALDADKQLASGDGIPFQYIVTTPACPVVACGVHDAFALAKKSPSRSWGDKPLCCHTVKAALREEKREAANCPNRTLSPCTHASDRGKPCLACTGSSGLIVGMVVDANESASCLAAQTGNWRTATLWSTTAP
jgi:hypothetical protein